MTDMAKRAAGRAAADLVRDGMRVGLGTGSTVFFALERLGERVRDEGLSITGVPTSRDTEVKAGRFGIPMATLEDVSDLDLAIDGADEVDASFRMIKGGGGALLREKVVASIARRVAIVVGPGKVVERLGTTFRLPLEVVPFARPVVERRVRALGLEPELRRTTEGPFRTDNGNEILDARAPDGIERPEELERALKQVPGLVETGLFLDLCHVLLVGSADGTVEVRENARS